MDEIKMLMATGGEALIDYLILNGHMPYTPHKKDIIKKYVDELMSIQEGNDIVSNMLFKASLDIKKTDN